MSQENPSTIVMLVQTILAAQRVQHCRTLLVGPLQSLVVHSIAMNASG